ncbi:protein kinase [Candidatus Woesearchaeota archaeon]|nr:protein kinase [Candidatus Woesearchaeota archaeon]
MVTLESKYDIFTRLGSGAISTVYLVQNKANGRYFAAKRANSPDKLRYLQREKDLFSSLHKNQGIVTFIESVEDVRAGFPYYNFANIFQYVGGEPLNDYLVNSDQKPLITFSPQEILWISQQLVSGLLYLHANGIIHGDLKPDNVMKNNLDIRIIDFSAARRIGDSQKVSGSLSYGAPEQWDHGSSFETDYYSLGALLNSLAKGQRLGFLDVFNVTSRHDISDKFKEGLSFLLNKNPSVRQKGLGLIL